MMTPATKDASLDCQLIANLAESGTGVSPVSWRDIQTWQDARATAACQQRTPSIVDAHRATIGNLLCLPNPATSLTFISYGR